MSLITYPPFYVETTSKHCSISTLEVASGDALPLVLECRMQSNYVVRLQLLQCTWVTIDYCSKLKWRLIAMARLKWPYLHYANCHCPRENKKAFLTDYFGCNDLENDSGNYLSLASSQPALLINSVPSPCQREGKGKREGGKEGGREGEREGWREGGRKRERERGAGGGWRGGGGEEGGRQGGKEREGKILYIHCAFITTKKKHQITVTQRMKRSQVKTSTRSSRQV